MGLKHRQSETISLAEVVMLLLGDFEFLLFLFTSLHRVSLCRGTLD
jgi:hypothetical protein